MVKENGVKNHGFLKSIHLKEISRQRVAVISTGGGHASGRLRIHSAGDWRPGRFGLGDGLGTLRALAPNAPSLEMFGALLLEKPMAFCLKFDRFHFRSQMESHIRKIPKIICESILSWILWRSSGYKATPPSPA